MSSERALRAEFAALGMGRGEQKVSVLRLLLDGVSDLLLLQRCGRDPEGRLAAALDRQQLAQIAEKTAQLRTNTPVPDNEQSAGPG